jgi:parvulin-like peptidyl-prolyl isomerase
MKLLSVCLTVVVALGALHAQDKPAKQAAPAAQAAAPAAKTAPKQFQPTDVIMTIGKESITYQRWQEMERGLPPQFKMACDQMGKRQCAEQFALILGLSHMAEEKKLDQTQEFKDQLAFARLQMLMQLGMQQLSTRYQAASDAEIKAYYDAHAAEYIQLKLRGIFVALAPPGKDAKPRTDPEAKQAAEALRKKIVDGADFAAVAKESSEEESTAPKGGDFGAVRKGQLPPRIEKAVFDLKVNEVSAPVQEARGYYLFKVEERKTTTVEEAKGEIIPKLQQAGLLNAIEEVKKQFPVKCSDEFCGPAAPAPGASPAAPSAAPPAAKK